VALYPWKEPKEHIPLALRHIRTFLRANEPAMAASVAVGQRAAAS